jgi:hypothetical protein
VENLTHTPTRPRFPDSPAHSANRWILELYGEKNESGFKWFEVMQNEDFLYDGKWMHDCSETGKQLISR